MLSFVCYQPMLMLSLKHLHLTVFAAQVFQRMTLNYPPTGGDEPIIQNLLAPLVFGAYTQNQEMRLRVNTLNGMLYCHLRVFYFYSFL